MVYRRATAPALGIDSLPATAHAAPPAPVSHTREQRLASPARQPALVVVVPAAHGLRAERASRHVAVILPQPHVGRFRDLRPAVPGAGAFALDAAPAGQTEQLRRFHSDQSRQRSVQGQRWL